MDGRALDVYEHGVFFGGVSTRAGRGAAAGGWS